MASFTVRILFYFFSLLKRRDFSTTVVSKQILACKFFLPCLFWGGRISWKENKMEEMKSGRADKHFASTLKKTLRSQAGGNMNTERADCFCFFFFFFWMKFPLLPNTISELCHRSSLTFNIGHNSQLFLVTTADSYRQKYGAAENWCGYYGKTVNK